jgi:hypothetical protein
MFGVFEHLFYGVVWREGVWISTHHDVSVDAYNFVEEVVAKSVHDGHDDDEGGDSEKDSDDGEPGDDGNEALTSWSSEVTPSDSEHEEGDVWRCHGCLLNGFLFLFIFLREMVRGDDEEICV